MIFLELGRSWSWVGHRYSWSWVGPCLLVGSYVGCCLFSVGRVGSLDIHLGNSLLGQLGRYG